MTDGKRINSFIKSFKDMDNAFSVAANGTYDTGINANAGDTQKVGYLFLIMGHTSAGDATYTRLFLVRLGYNGDHVTTVKIAESGSSQGYTQTFGINSDKHLTISSNILCKVCIL